MNYLKGNTNSTSRLLDKNELLDIFNDNNYVKVFKNSDLQIKTSIDNIPISILLLQTGYFALRKLNLFEICLALPNAEVSDSLILLLMHAQNTNISNDTKNNLLNLPKMLDNLCIDDIAKLFSSILIESISPNSNAFKNENALRDIIFIMILLMII